MNRVNIVITNRVLRYSFHKGPKIEEMVDHGEIELPSGMLKDGHIEDRIGFLSIIKHLVNEHKWKRRRLYFSMPDDTVVIRELEVPVGLTKEEALGYVKTQIGTSFYLPFHDPALDIDYVNEEIEETAERQKVLVYAYPQGKITEFQDVFMEAGLDPYAADLTSLSVYRLYYLYSDEDLTAADMHVLLIHWNSEALVLTAFKEHKAVFTRHIKVENKDEEEGSSQSEYAEQKAKIQINELMTEINRIIDFYQYSITGGKAQINRLLLSGDFPYLDTVETMLKEQVEIPIEPFTAVRLPRKFIDVLGLGVKEDI